MLALGRRAAELREDVKFLTRADDPGHVYYLDIRGRGVFLRASPIDVSDIIREMLLDRMHATVLTSATLTVDGRFDYVRGRLGVRHAHEARLASEFDYTRQAMADAHRQGAPVMRGMFFEFPDDERAWTTPGQYLFGPDILVAPVTVPGATRWDVYLPAGAEWTDARTGEMHTGGAAVTVDAPLASIPVFHRGGRVGDALARLADLPHLTLS